MALAVYRTGVILEKRDLSCHRPQSVGRCATATYQSTCPANTIHKRPAAAAQVARAADLCAIGCGLAGAIVVGPVLGAVAPTGSVCVRATWSRSSGTRPGLGPPAIDANDEYAFVSGWREWPDAAVRRPLLLDAR
jgi:hypothetical protein